MRDFTDDLAALRRRLGEAERYLDVEGKRKRLAELETEVGRPDLWDDPDAARAVTTEYQRVKEDVDVIERLGAKIEDAETLHLLAVEEGDESQAAEIEAGVAELQRAFADLELRSLFSGEHDERNAICNVQAGAGGTDAQDWAQMMVRMYQRWAERRGMQFEVEDVSEGQEAGILSATFIVRGRYSYGLLGGEQGTHRLVRISPFDAQNRRQTSFASLEVVPALEDLSEVQIDEKDLRIDTFRSSGAGGQHVNVTDSAVRITHLPTGIVTSCQNERSQMQNKAKAMEVLAAKLAERQREERRAELEAITGPTTQASWGTQIRSYVMAPYQLVKDLRTDYETGNVQAVIDGELDPFIEAWLRWRREQQEANPAPRS
ncbi:MAG: peptide chain release factor 2 [Acidimicrobiaceae bacterium]|jgi:peptide chain release factor 2|nr:peptide chain release factor 2 [Acidimicrobiaceae bacterium]